MKVDPNIPERMGGYILQKTTWDKEPKDLKDLVEDCVERHETKKIVDRLNISIQTLKDQRDSLDIQIEALETERDNMTRSSQGPTTRYQSFLGPQLSRP